MSCDEIITNTNKHYTYGSRPTNMNGFFQLLIAAMAMKPGPQEFVISAPDEAPPYPILEYQRPFCAPRLTAKTKPKPYDHQAAERLQAERRGRKAAAWAKRQPKGKA